jgi:hypothetical protein
LDLDPRDLGSRVTLWDANYLLQPHPDLRSLLLSPVARGAVSGLGLVNVLLALHEVRQLVTGKGERT